MVADVHRVAIIGAGACGLPAIKSCLEEGLEPVCFERRDRVGGLWNFTEDVVEGQACVMRSTVTNIPKEQSCYSDFLFPPEWPNFMHHSKYKQYYQLYANHFGLNKYIRFKTAVLEMRQTQGNGLPSKWIFRTQPVDGGDIIEEVFDAVMVCCGHLFKPFFPNIPGLKDFKGKVIHAHQYKDNRAFIGKTVLLIGLGNSGADASVDLSQVAKQVSFTFVMY